MKTQDNKLSFNRNALVELNNDELLDISAGTASIVAALVILAYIYH